MILYVYNCGKTETPLQESCVLTDAVDCTAEYGGEHGERDVGSHGNHCHRRQVGRHVLLGLLGACARGIEGRNRQVGNRDKESHYLSTN